MIRCQKKTFRCDQAVALLIDTNNWIITHQTYCTCIHSVMKALLFTTVQKKVSIILNGIEKVCSTASKFQGKEGVGRVETQGIR